MLRTFLCRMVAWYSGQCAAPGPGISFEDMPGSRQWRYSIATQSEPWLLYLDFFS